MSEQQKTEIKDRLRKALKARGVTHLEAAEKSGIPYKTLQKWLEGSTIPRMDAISQFCSALSLNPSFLLLGEGFPLLPHQRGITRQEEQLLKTHYRHLVDVLSHVNDPWIIIPKAALDSFKRKETDIFTRKVLNWAKATLKAFYSIALELPGEAIFFFFKNRYWAYSVWAIWRFYWALALDLPPASTDLAVVAALKYKSNDFLASAKRLKDELKMDWPLKEEAIKKEKFPLQPGQAIEPETLIFLSFASEELITLYKQKKLPFVCLAHHEVFWTSCSVCDDLKRGGFVSP